jgi:hypothetical protein
VIVIDTKNKELVGNVRNGGDEYRPANEPEAEMAIVCRNRDEKRSG